MSEAQAAYGRGEADVAITLLTDYANRVRASSLEPSKVSLLLKPIDTRLGTYRVMQRPGGGAVREKREKQDARDLITGRNAAEDQRRAEVGRLIKECTFLAKEKKDYAAAERVALQAKQLDPDNPAVEAMVHLTKMNRRVRDYEKIKSDKEDYFVRGLNDVDKAGPSLTTDNPVEIALDRYRLNGTRRGTDDTYQRPAPRPSSTSR